MNRHVDGSANSRGTVLVASDSSLFRTIVGDMLADDGLVAAFPVEAEAAWLSVTRTQPALVICDSGIPTANVRRLIAEVSARHLPLLMAWPQEEHAKYAPGLALPDRVSWLTFPIDRDAFRAAIDGLLPSLAGRGHRLTLVGAGVTVDAGFRTRSLEGIGRDDKDTR
jgi:DNA-binding NtrC family response regulator